MSFGRVLGDRNSPPETIIAEYRGEGGRRPVFNSGQPVLGVPSVGPSAVIEKIAVCVINKILTVEDRDFIDIVVGRTLGA
jgi:hypothetical protein